MIQITLPYPPSVNGIWRHTGKKSYLAPKAKAWKDAAKWSVMETMMKGTKPINGPFNIHIEVGRPDKRKRDLDNLIKVVLDSVVAGCAIRDDSDAQMIVAQWVPDLKGVRVTITTEPSYYDYLDGLKQDTAKYAKVQP